MGNTAKLMLVGVLALVIVIAVIWDRESSELEVAAVPPVDEVEDEQAPTISEQAAEITGEIEGAEPSIGQVEAQANAFMEEFIRQSGSPVGQQSEGQQIAVQPQTPAPQQPAQDQAKTYITQAGDTFWELSRKFYGTTKYHLKLWEFNKDRIGRPELLREGMTIRIPKFDTSREVLVNEPAHDATAANGARTYTVKEGDCLGIISQKFYGTSRKWQKILDANDLEDERDLRAGMTITIPADN